MPTPRPVLSQVYRPIASARGLSNGHYTNPEVHAEELKTVLAANWAGLGVASEVPEPGDACPKDFLGQPVLVIRDREGTIRVFLNVCRHRGMILVDAPTRIKGAIRCPYHSWCYATDGRLISTPHVGGPGQNTHPGIDRTALGLVELRSHVWRDVVFVNLSGDAKPFGSAMADIMARWAAFDQPLFHGGTDSQFHLALACNWKLAVENYCESYHLPWVHPGLNSYSRLEDHYHIEAPVQFAGQGTQVYAPLKDKAGSGFPDFDNLSPKWSEAAEYVAVFPNVLMGVHRDHAFAIILRPEAMDRTIEEVHLYYARPDTDPALRKINADRWKEVFIEDIAVVEGMQRGRLAAGFDGGRFSPVMEGPTHLFHDWVAAQMNLRPEPPAETG